MARVQFQKTSPFSFAAGRPWIPTLGIWGVGAGSAVLFVLSVTPLVKNGFLINVPVVGSYFEDKTPASDKPF